jgi:hypothetical protein
MDLYERLVLEADEEFPTLKRGRPGPNDVRPDSWTGKVHAHGQRGAMLFIPHHIGAAPGSSFKARFDRQKNTLTVQFMTEPPAGPAKGGWVEGE